MPHRILHPVKSLLNAWQDSIDSRIWSQAHIRHVQGQLRLCLTYDVDSCGYERKLYNPTLGEKMDPLDEHLHPHSDAAIC